MIIFDHLTSPERDGLHISPVYVDGEFSSVRIPTSTWKTAFGASFAFSFSSSEEVKSALLPGVHSPFPQTG